MLLSYNADLLPKVRIVGHVRYSEPWSHFPRTIDEYILYVIRDGLMYLQEDGARYALKSGDFFLLEPGLPHVGYQKASCDYYYIHFSHPEISRAQDEAAAMEELRTKRHICLMSYDLDSADPTDSTTFIPKHCQLQDYKTALHSMVECYCNREEHYKRRCASLLHSFLLQVSHEQLLQNCSAVGKKVSRSHIAAEQLLRYLNQNYAEHITSADISERFEINFDYLNRRFSQMTGTSIFAYINALRIYQAKQLIATTELTFSEIAYSVGIDDRYYFSRLFKKTTGMSPTEYYKGVHSK